MNTAITFVGDVAEMLNPGVLALSLALDIDTDTKGLTSLYHVINLSDSGEIVAFESSVSWNLTLSGQKFVRVWRLS